MLILRCRYINFIGSIDQRDKIHRLRPSKVLYRDRSFLNIGNTSEMSNDDCSKKLKSLINCLGLISKFIFKVLFLGFGRILLNFEQLDLRLIKSFGCKKLIRWNKSGSGNESKDISPVWFSNHFLPGLLLKQLPVYCKYGVLTFPCNTNKANYNYYLIYRCALLYYLKG